MLHQVSYPPIGREVYQVCGFKLHLRRALTQADQRIARVLNGIHLEQTVTPKTGGKEVLMQARVTARQTESPP
jgi:hypothetical protein